MLNLRAGSIVNSGALTEAVFLVARGIFRSLPTGSTVQQIVWMTILRRNAGFTCALLLVSLPALGRSGNGFVASPNSAYQHRADDRRDNDRRDSRPPRNFDNGLRQGGRGGQYDDRNDHRDDHYDHRDDRGGIGPGKGALIGGAGGAVLGAVLGQSLKGSLVGGATGAGIGAIVGGIAQSNRDSHHH